MREKKGWNKGGFICQRSEGMSHGLERGMQRRKKRGSSGGRNEIAGETSGGAIKIDMFEEPGFFGQSNSVCVFAAR